MTLAFEQRYVALYTDQTFIEVSNNGGDSYDYSYEINTELSLSQFVQENHFLDITEAASEQEFVKIRFRWVEESGDLAFGSGYGWMIDDFTLLESFDYDQKITEVFHKSWLGSYMPNGMKYYKISENQIQEIHFSAIVVNQGASMQENLKLNVEITGAETFNTISEVFDLPINSTDSIGTIDSFTPSSVGVYNIKYWFDSDHTEDVTFNDTIFDEFEVTTGPDAGGFYARHSNYIFTDISNIASNISAPFLIGNVMEVKLDTKFKEFEIDIAVHTSNFGQKIFVQVMRYNAIADKFDYVNQTDDHTITDEEIGGTVTLYVEDLICVEANDVILLLAGHYGTGGGGATNDVHFRQSQKVDFGTVLGYTSGAIEPFALLNPRALMIRAKAPDSYGCDGAINEIIQGLHILISQNTPNPFFQSTIIAYELIKNEDVQVTITDLSGKIIESINLGNQAGGQHELRLNANDYSEGVYFYTFIVGEEQVTKRMIVLK